MLRDDPTQVATTRTIDYKRMMPHDEKPVAPHGSSSHRDDVDEDPARPPLRPRVSDGPRPIATSAILSKVLKRAGLTDQARRLAVLGVWNRSVGRDIAARTTPVAFSRGTLVIKAASSAWQNELTFLAPTIIAALNNQLGHRMVKELKFVAGHYEGPSRESPPPRIVPDEQEVLAAREAAASIVDPEIRRAFERLSAVGMAAAHGGSRSRPRTSSE